jgi:hypothetical protein
MEMNNLIKLVNAVRSGKESTNMNRNLDEIPDGRIYPLPQTVMLEETRSQTKDAEDAKKMEFETHPHGRDLLKHSQTASSTAYVLPNLSNHTRTSD